MSRESEHRFKAMDSSSSESLPDEWTSVQKRLDHVESVLLKLTKRSQKLQKRLQQQSEEMFAGRKDTRALVLQILEEQSNQLSVKEKELQVQNMRAQLDDLHGYIKRVEKKSNEMMKEIKGTGFTGLSDSRIDDRIEERVDRQMQKHQQETAKAIAELRRIVSGISRGQIYQHPSEQKQYEYARESTPIDRKSSEKLLSNSRSKTNIQHTNQKSYRASQVEIQYQEPSIDRNLKSRSPQTYSHSQQQLQNQTQPNASSRVSYLREKLKEFEEANKKFEEKIEKPEESNTPQGKGRSVQKLKDFKNYLEQSESELDQSNLEPTPSPHNVLTDSIKNWRKGYQYE